MRIDAFATFIAAYLTDTGTAARQPGARCLHATHCAQGECLAAADQPLLRFCSTGCDGDRDCASAMCCSGDGDAARCRYPTPSPGALGSSCTSDADCVLSVCQREHPDDALGFCTNRCGPSFPECPTGFECVRFGNINFYCALEQGSGCSVSGRRGGAGWWLLVGGLFIAVAWRRRVVARSGCGPASMVRSS